MQVFLRLTISIVLLSLLAGCSSKFRSYDGPEVTKIIVFKEARAMHLMHQKTVLKSYRIDLGFAPRGHKTVSGDGKTPEGSLLYRPPQPEKRVSPVARHQLSERARCGTCRKTGKKPGR